MKYNNLELGTIEAIVNKLGGMDGVHRFLSDEITVSEPVRSWREEDDVIYFSVTSNGTTGEDWIKRLGENGLRLSGYAKSVLHSPDFKPTSNVTTQIAVLKGNLFPSDIKRTTANIRAETDRRKLLKPNAEVACLIREKFTDKEIEAMGLWWIVAMHEPIKDSDGYPYLLTAGRGGVGRWLDACWVKPDYLWYREYGFAFAVSQVSA